MNQPMKTILDAATREELINRINTLDETALNYLCPFTRKILELFVSPS